MFHSFTPETDKSAYSGGGRLTLPLCIDVGCWNIYMYAKRTSRFMRFFFLLLEYTCTFMHYAVDVGSCSVRRMLNWRLPDENSPESLFFFFNSRFSIFGVCVSSCEDVWDFYWICGLFESRLKFCFSFLTLKERTSKSPWKCFALWFTLFHLLHLNARKLLLQ